QDVTSRCQLPRGPLPADRRRYLADQRVIAVPLDWGEREAAVVELRYRLLEPRFQTLVPPDRSPQTLAVELRRGLRFPVGRAGGPTLPGCVCVHHGGLRPAPEKGVLEQRLQHVRQVAPDRLVYARFEELATPTSVEARARGFDFCVVGP